MDFPLLIPDNKFNLNIRDLLEFYFSPENIEFKIKFSKYNKKCIHSKYSKISYPPNILILSLQRFNKNTNSKNNCFIKYSENLIISYFIDKEWGYDRDTIYHLYGVINHKGSLSSGHYYSYVKFSEDTYNK